MTRLFREIILITFFSSLTYAQSVSGNLSGRVLDQTGAAIQNAAVTVADKARNLTRKTSSDSAGDFQVSGLDPGDYAVTATAAGFASRTAQFPVRLGQTTNAALTLVVA